MLAHAMSVLRRKLRLVVFHFHPIVVVNILNSYCWSFPSWGRSSSFVLSIFFIVVDFSYFVRYSLSVNLQSFIAILGQWTPFHSQSSSHFSSLNLLPNKNHLNGVFKVEVQPYWLSDPINLHYYHCWLSILSCLFLHYGHCQLLLFALVFTFFHLCSSSLVSLFPWCLSPSLMASIKN